MPITSAQNSKIKLVNSLRSKRGRQREGRFVIDYERDLQRALRQGYEIDFLLHCRGFDPAPHFDGFDDIEAQLVTPSLFKGISYRENPADIIAVLHSKPAKKLPQLKAQEIQQAILLIELQVPGNIGALLRTADAAGMDAVILVDTVLDLYNPNIIRSSTGACFLDTVYRLSSEEALGFLISEGFKIVAAADAGKRRVYDLDFRSKTAIALGSEDRGLPRAWLDCADHIARIPMEGAVSDSLNVSVSGALFMYEMYRQKLAACQKG